MTMHHENSLSLINDLLEFGDLKVWSVIVTILGDRFLSQPNGLGGPALTQILGQLGIKPSAIRVALHRLSNDGWLEIDKQGRTSFYRLSTMGQAKTKAVSKLVFSAKLATDRERFLVLAARDISATKPDCAVALTRRIWITRTRPSDPDLLVAKLDEAPLPAWVKSSLVPDKHLGAFERLADILTQGASPPPAMDPQQVAVLRTLVLHHWRRLALRHPETIWRIMGQDWAGAECRTVAVAWLDRLAPR